MGGSDSGPPHRFREIRPCHLSYEFAALPRIGDWTVQIVKRSDTAKGFELMPRRWVVERTLAWIGRCRRLAKDWEKSIASAEARVFVAHTVKQIPYKASLKVRRRTLGWDDDYLLAALTQPHK